jgi:hypothetical protein
MPACGSKFAEQNQDQHDNEYETDPATTVVASPVERTTSEPAEASEQYYYQEDEQDGSDRHSLNLYLSRLAGRESLVFLANWASAV